MSQTYIAIFPHELGKQAISFLIDKYPDTLHPRFSKTFIIDGIEIILNNNSFQFNNINYIQTLGTAIGTKLAPTYPNPSICRRKPLWNNG